MYVLRMAQLSIGRWMLDLIGPSFLKTLQIKTRNRLKVFLGWKTNVVNRYQSKKNSHESFCFFSHEQCCFMIVSFSPISWLILCISMNKRVNHEWAAEAETMATEYDHSDVNFIFHWISFCYFCISPLKIRLLLL